MTEKKITDDQLRAVLTVDKPLCIRAGAGSGKTSVLAYHYAALLLLEGLKPSEVVAVTFTEKAAGELKERIQKVLQEAEQGKLPFQEKVYLKPVEIELLLKEIPQAPISTIHSLAARIVREASLLTGFDPHFLVLDANQAHALKVDALQLTLSELLNQDSKALKTLIQGYGFGAVRRQLLKMLEDWPRWKAPFEASELAEEARIESALQEVFSAILKSYGTAKLKRQALDFDDLEEEALKLLKEHPLVTRHYRRLWRAYLVDEFQDVSEKQDLLISALLEIDEDGVIPAGRHLAVVGDEKQSIYSFRGAEPGIFEKFQERIEKSGGLTVTLSKNFRSPPRILRWVNTHFREIFPHYPPLEAHGEDSAEVSLEVLLPPMEEEGKKLKAEGRRQMEAKRVAERIAAMLKEGQRPSEIFLLFRTLSSVSLYQKALAGKKIPTYLRGSESLLERQEILDLIHALRAVAEPENPLPWVGLLRSPAVSLSDEALLAHALKTGKEKNFSELHPLFSFLKNRDPREGPYEFLSDFLEKTELVSLYASHEDLAPKAQNLLQFLNGAYQWESQEGGDLKQFLKEMDLLIKSRIPWEALSDQLGAGEAVTLMTVHQAKGLDFPVVVLPDLGAGGQADVVPIAERFGDLTGLRLPRESQGLKPATEDSEALKNINDGKKRLGEQEEDRIFYVAATRAKKRLILGFLPQEGREKRPVFLKLGASLNQSPGVAWISEAPTSLPSDPPEPSAPLPSPLAPLQKALRTRFAVTELECFLNSKEEYRARYLYRLPPDTTDFSGGLRKQEDPSSLDPLERGILVHESLRLISEPERSWTAREALKVVWNRRFEVKEQEAGFEEVVRGLEKTLNHPSFQSILKAEEGYSEVPFLLALPPYQIRGAMDRLIRIQNDWVVVDYKTHASPDEETAKGFEFQMKTYCLAASRMLGKDVGEARLYFVEPNTLHSFQFSPSDMKAHEKKLMALMDEVNEWRRTLE